MSISISISITISIIIIIIIFTTVSYWELEIIEIVSCSVSENVCKKNSYRVIQPSTDIQLEVVYEIQSFGHGKF